MGILAHLKKPVQSFEFLRPKSAHDLTVEGDELVKVLEPNQVIRRKLEKAGYRVLVSYTEFYELVCARAQIPGRLTVVADSGWRVSLEEALSELAGELGIPL